MADTNDRHQGSDHDLFDETAPRSIFAATWFRAVLVLIVLGVIGAVAVPYILDAMNAPKPSATAKLPVPVPASRPPTPPPVAVTPVTPPSAPPGMAATPAPPLGAVPAPATPPSTAATVPATPAPPLTTEQPSDTKLSDTKPFGDGRLADSSGPDTLKPADTAKPSAATTPGGKKDAMGAATTSKTTATPKTAVKTAKVTGRQWYVQVGAFKDAGTAKNVAAKLREDNYKVDDDSSRAVATVGKTTIASPSDSGDQYDVIITGQSPAELNTRLAAKGLTAEAAGNAAVVKPSLPLRDAVALSKDLAVDGLKVQVRRTGGSTATAARTSSGDALHRVSVGGFPDKATAMATLKELEGKGYKPFLTRR